MTEQEELTLFMINASGNYLTEELPDNFAEIDEGVLHRFIQEHLWQPFEDYYDEPQQVYEFIANSAYNTMLFTREHNLKED